MISPVETCWAEQGSRPLMVEAAIDFDASGQWRDKGLPFRRDPLENGSFEALGIITAGP